MPLCMIALTAYFAIGLILAFIGPAARERRREQRKTKLDTHNIPRWKLRAFAFALIGGIVLLWPYLVPSAARIGRRPVSAWDALQRLPPFQEQQMLQDAMIRLCEGGVDADELPNGRGEFGWDPANPIPCNTVFGSTVYLSRLRASDGAKVVYTRARGLSHRKRRRIRWMPMKYRILMGAN
ncbi:MAG TPA: hypothetical protein VGL34_12690 [Steroidobacteraceae bacterium]